MIQKENKIFRKMFIVTEYAALKQSNKLALPQRDDCKTKL